MDLRELEDLAPEFKISISSTSLFLKNGSKLIEFCGTNESQFMALVRKHKLVIKM